MQEMGVLRLRKVGDMFTFTQQLCNRDNDKAVSSGAWVVFSVMWVHWSLCFRTTGFLEDQTIGATIIAADICQVFTVCCTQFSALIICYPTPHSCFSNQGPLSPLTRGGNLASDMFNSYFHELGTKSDLPESSPAQVK